jgi:hypothetical protein
MTNEKFNEFWDNIFVPEIKLVLSYGNRPCSDERLNSLKQFTEQKYCEQNVKIKDFFRDLQNLGNVINKQNDIKIDRHKVAAALYVAFIEAAKSLPLIESKTKNEFFRGIQEFFAHRIAFYASLYTLQSFINKEDSDFSRNFMLKGFSEPLELICEDKNRNYYDHTICQLWFADRYRTLSVLQLSNMLYLIELNFRERYKRQFTL